MFGVMKAVVLQGCQMPAPADPPSLVAEAGKTLSRQLGAEVDETTGDL
jgi:hypothetical protein